MHLNQLPFSQIVSGEKTLEIRLNDSKRQLLNVGDEILFSNRENHNQTVLKHIKALRHYDSFTDFALNEDTTTAGFNQSYNTQDVVDCYHTYYTPQEEHQYGVLVIELCD